MSQMPLYYCIMLIFLVTDCVCGVVGTSFLVVVGQHEDSWVGSILRHIQVGPRRVIRRPMEDSAYNAKLPESRRTLSPLVISRLYMICNPRPRVCYRSLGASSSIVYRHIQCLVFTCTLYTPLSLIYSTRSRLFLQLQGSDPNQGKTLPRITIQPNSQGYPTE